jgi:UDPglucose--hexose-1-phosphate uridylyltransferase
VNELRVDPLTGLRSVIAAARADRPGGHFDLDPPPPIDAETDPFAPGHEDRTPPEVYAVRPDGGGPDTPGWTVRVVPNLYPALTQDAHEPEPEANPDLFTAQPAAGHHEVIVNAPDTVSSLTDLEPEQVEVAMEAWRARMRAHAGCACRHLIVNERREAGASLPHTHAQLYALRFVPAAIARERERFTAYATRTMGGDLLGDLVQEEVRRRERIVAIDDEAVAIAPYASRVPFQLMIAPRRSRPRFEDDGPLGARLLHDVLSRLRRRLGASPPLNLWVRTAPSGADHFCWRIDVLPRLTHLAGLELGTGVNLCITAPEQAAAELRDI